MKILALGALALAGAVTSAAGVRALGLAGGSHEGWSAHTRRAAFGQVTAVTRSANPNTWHFTLRLDDSLADIAVTPRSAITSIDGQVMSIDAIRVGDSVVARPDGTVTDLSQRLAGFVGTVVDMADAQGDPLVLQTGSGDSVVVDVSHATLVTDKNDLPSSIDDVQETDCVRASGLFDSAAGEMTQTMAIAQLTTGCSPGATW